MYTDFNEEVFKASVNEALQSVKRVLDINRSPHLHLADDVDHTYTDKFQLANLLTNTTIISVTIILERFGLTKEVLQSIDTTQPITLRFSASESCRFVKEETVDVPLPLIAETNEVTKVTTGYEDTNTQTSKSTIKEVVNRVIQQHYKIETEWEISIYTGTDIDNRRVIKNRSNGCFDFIWAKSKNPPLPLQFEHAPVDLSLTWLVQQIDTKQLKSHFAIDTTQNQNHKTKTPRRNIQIEESLSFFSSFYGWTNKVYFHFAKFYPRSIFNKHAPAIISSSSTNENGNHNEQSLANTLGTFSSNEIFIPVIPLLVDDNDKIRLDSVDDDSVQSKAILDIWSEREEDNNNMNNNNEYEEEKEGGHDTMLPASPSSHILSSADTTRFLNEQVRTIMKTEQKIERQYSNDDIDDTKLIISSIEVNLSVLCNHSKMITNRYAESIQSIEFLLEQQLVAAIGKEVNSTDVDKFVKYHNKKMFHSTYSPQPKI